MPRTKPFSQLEEKARQKNPGWDADVAVIKRAVEDALNLAELRQHRNVTQVQLADALEIGRASCRERVYSNV